jgi:hypothetical protein
MQIVQDERVNVTTAGDAHTPFITAASALPEKLPKHQNFLRQQHDLSQLEPQRIDTWKQVNSRKISIRSRQVGQQPHGPGGAP